MSLMIFLLIAAGPFGVSYFAYRLVRAARVYLKFRTELYL